jgi:FecR-like protein
MMTRRVSLFRISIALAATVILGVQATSRAQDAPPAWQVSKSSGQVWLTSSGVQPASLSEQGTLKPGDSIRTGRNGRVLLVRGQETILIAPNSEITLPAAPKNAQADGQWTRIIERAGSILLEVDKRKVRNFEVETPYLVAAVKGTQFRVTLDRVDVLQGSVQVADAQSGQYALVMPGQSAKAGGQSGGLSLSGAGPLGPIQKGEPRSNGVPGLRVPRGGLTAPTSLPDGQHVRALGSLHAHAGELGGGARALRINMPLGEAKLDINKVTNGLARDGGASIGGHAAKATVWSSGDINPGNGVGKSYGLGNSGSGTGGVSGNGNAGGNGNGNTYGQANALANGNGVGNGNGNAYGIGNGNVNGNGNANGQHKGH